MALKAIDVAKWFIAHDNAVNPYTQNDKLSNLHLNGLLYYAQGCTLANTDDVLFDDDIIAWKGKPRIESVYTNYGELMRYPENADIFNTVISEFLIPVYNKFGQCSTLELMTKVYKDELLATTTPNNPISVSATKDLFKRKYTDITINPHLIENLTKLRTISDLKDNWDGEGTPAFDRKFIAKVANLITILPEQPNLCESSMWSIDLEFGLFMSGKRGLWFEIFNEDAHVQAHYKTASDIFSEDIMEMEDIYGRVQQFLN